MSNPYTYSGTSVLINKFDLINPNVLQDLEAVLFYYKVTQDLPQGNFDYEHLKAIHKHYFGDLYSWAGKERSVDIAKGGSYFAHKYFILGEINKLFTKLKYDNYLQSLNHQEFSSKL